jgi:hypothetical protein
VTSSSTFDFAAVDELLFVSSSDVPMPSSSYVGSTEINLF